MKVDKKKVAVVGVIGMLACGALGGLAGAKLFPEVKEVIKEIPVDKIVKIEVPIEVEVEKLVTEYVDNGDLDLVLDYLEENFGHEGVFEDIDLIVNNIKMEDVAIGKALNFLQKEWFDILDDEGFRDSDFDDFRTREIRLRKIYSDLDDIDLVDTDYEDDDFEVKIELKVEGRDADDEIEDVEKRYAVTLRVDEGDVDVIDMEQV